MAKKKRTSQREYGEFSDPSLKVGEEPNEDEEEGEASETEELFAEDEDDIAIMRSLESEDESIAFSTFMYDEEVGFNPYMDWSPLPEVERSKYAATMALEQAELEALAWKKMTPFHKWIVARACNHLSLHGMFREICLNIIRSRKKQDDLCIPEIYQELISDYVETREYDEAFHWLDKFEAAFPEDAAAALRIRGLLHIEAGDIDKGKEILNELIHRPFNHDIKGFEDDKSVRHTSASDGVLHYEIGYALLNMRHHELAMEYFDKAKNLAFLYDNYELTTAIDNARAMTAQEMAEEEQ